MLIPRCLDGAGPPQLRIFINAGNLQDLKKDQGAPDLSTGEPALEILLRNGFTGIQGAPEALVPTCHRLGLITAAQGRIDYPEEIHSLAQRWQDEGHACGTLHVGTGMEDDDTCDRLCAEVMATSARLGIPLFIETHRATITQDQWRTVKLVERNPNLRFNGDFSHWYTGQEMTYGGIDRRCDFLKPVFERTRFFHGRIGNSGCIQVSLTDPSAQTAIGHFRSMWTHCLRAFRQQAIPGEWIAFTPELLNRDYHYARCIPSRDATWQEEGDRWQDALELNNIMKACWDDAH